MFKKTIIIFSIVLFVILATVSVADAQTGVDQLRGNLGSFGAETGLGDDADLKTKIADIINIVLGFLGLAAAIMIIYAGFKWMTAGGNEEVVTEARRNIKNAVIGIIIVLLSYAIINFVVTQVSDVTGQTQQQPAGPVLGNCNFPTPDQCGLESSEWTGYEENVSMSNCSLAATLACGVPSLYVWSQ